MTSQKVGIWMIGALGGVGSTMALGLAALARNLSAPTGLLTSRPEYAGPWDEAAQFVVGGHDIRQTSFSRTVAELHSRSNVFADPILAGCTEQLQEWTANIRPGVMFQPNTILTSMADRPDNAVAKTGREAITRIQADLREFQEKHQLSQVVVVNVASTEPLFDAGPATKTLAHLDEALKDGKAAPLPMSSLYAYAAIEMGLPYLNGTPSLGASIPAIEQLANLRKVPLAGQDFKTGETLMKSVLAPMFAKRNLRVLSWVGHNILGNRDGMILMDPTNKASKVKSKDALISEILGYKPQTHVSIEYVESLDDWKTAWDHIHYEGFLGTKMTLQFTWQGCDSLLAAPLGIDVARVLLAAQRRGQFGSLKDLAAFFKSPVGGVTEHDFGRQFELTHRYLLSLSDAR
jgi:myo-inositol-1-phosphate synthase